MCDCYFSDQLVLSNFTVAVMNVIEKIIHAFVLGLEQFDFNSFLASSTAQCNQ